MIFSSSSVVQALCFSLSLSTAATVPYEFNITWVTANPDHLFDRPTIGINNEWPLPVIEVNKGDRLLVKINNQLGNQSTSLHFHGLYQNGTTDMDGVVGVTQCAAAPGSSFTYDFVVNQPGTYWYHSHERGQYPDGLRGALIVHDPESPYREEYSEEVVMTLSDWYHDQMVPLISSFINYKNPTGAEPVPNAALMNDTQNLTMSVKPGETYFFRMINVGAFAGQYFWIEGHTMRVIEVDGVYTDPYETDLIYLTAAQRYGFLLTARNDTSENFPMIASMDQDLFDKVPPTLNPNVTGWLSYNDANPMPAAKMLESFDPLDDMLLTPQDHQAPYADPSQTIVMTMEMDNLGDGANYAFINGVSYVRPKVPTLYSALSTSTYATDPAVYGMYSNAFVLAHNEVIDIVLNNNDAGKHPFHLHGHNFQAILRAPADAGFFNDSAESLAPETLAKAPMRRDTLMVYPNSHYVIRFRSDNPGIWLFHCHIEWHIDSGLIATIVEAPLALQDHYMPLSASLSSSLGSASFSANSSTARRSIPKDHLEACISSDTPYQGNAAGNTQNYLDLNGENQAVAPLPAGFTAKGIVALVFSCVSAFLGLALISWYGAAPISKTELDIMQQKVKNKGTT